jgi:molybdopterin synthase sulfur carrier subunit
MINVLYFAQVAEHMGCRQETLALDEPVPAAQWLAALEARCPALAPTARLKLAINQHHSNHSAIIQPGDEVAVFEPVTGG